MALSALTLSVTSGVQGRPFQATINGLTTGKVEVLNDGSPGFSTVNGKLMSHGLPYPVSTVVLREWEPGVGQGYRDTRIDITAATEGQLYNLAVGSLGVGRTLKRYRTAGERQSDGSIVYSVYAEDDLGATAKVAVGGDPTPVTVRRMAGISGDIGGNTLRKSNGTNTTFNSRMRFYTPVPIPNPSVVYTGFFYDSSLETDNPNNVSYQSSIEIAGVAYATTNSGGSTAAMVVAPGTILAQTDPIAGLTIPAGYYYVNTFGQVAPGEFWYYTDTFRNAARGNMEEGVGLANKTMVPATIGNDTQYIPAGGVGVIGDMPLSHRLFALVGDSISQGVGNYFHPTIPVAFGVLAGMIADRPSASAFHLGRSGASVNSARTNHAKRTAFMTAAGVTDVFCDLAVNDFAGGFAEVNVRANLKTLFGLFRTAIPAVRLYQSTCTPSTALTSSPTSDTNQTTSAQFTDGRRNVFNSNIRSGSGWDGLLASFVEFAIPSQNALNADWWVAGYCSDASPGPALHPNQTGGNALVTAASATNAMGL